MTQYIAVIHKDPDSDFGVSFPDFPGCITAGSTMQEAAEMAAEALAGHVSVMREYGDHVPSPSTIEEVQAHEFYQGAVAVMLVDLADESPLIRFNMTTKKNILDQIDMAARESGMTRSGFMVAAALKEIQRGQ